MNAITTSFLNQLEAIEKTVDEIIIHLFDLLTGNQRGTVLITCQSVLETKLFIRVLLFKHDLSKLKISDKLKVLNIIENVIELG